MRHAQMIDALKGQLTGTMVRDGARGELEARCEHVARQLDEVERQHKDEVSQVAQQKNREIAQLTIERDDAREGRDDAYEELRMGGVSHTRTEVVVELRVLGILLYSTTIRPSK